MINKEKIVEGLELCLKTIDEPDCRKECPYYEACQKYEGRVIFQPLMRDTLTLLKEQEAMPIKDDRHWTQFKCPRCNAPLQRTTFFKMDTRFCKYCGQEVKFE